MEDEKKKKSFGQKLLEGFKEGFKTMNERATPKKLNLESTEYYETVRRKKKPQS